MFASISPSFYVDLPLVERRILAQKTDIKMENPPPTHHATVQHQLPTLDILDMIGLALRIVTLFPHLLRTMALSCLLCVVLVAFNVFLRAFTLILKICGLLVALAQSIFRLAYIIILRCCPLVLVKATSCLLYLGNFVCWLFLCVVSWIVRRVFATDPSPLSVTPPVTPSRASTVSRRCVGKTRNQQQCARVSNNPSSGPYYCRQHLAQRPQNP